MSIRNIIALILILISLVCLYPGLTEPILSIKVAAKLPIVGELNLYETIQSILGTIETLFQNDNALVGFLILLFSVIVPIFKAIALLSSLFILNEKWGSMTNKMVSIISKWSMADVFVVGVFLAFLATKSEDSIHAELHPGFYYFLAYCLISILSSLLIEPRKPKLVTS